MIIPPDAMYVQAPSAERQQLAELRECVYCGLRSATISRQCCKEGWYFDALYSICAPFYYELEGRLFNRHHVQWLMSRLENQLQEFCDEQGVGIDGMVDCNLGVLCELNLRPRYLSRPNPSRWLPDDSQRRMIWNDVIVKRLGR